MLLAVLLAVLSVWDYPSRQVRHEQFRRQFLQAVQTGDEKGVLAACESGAKLLPDDPTWRYNLACALSHFPDREKRALDELEKAIDLGFRDVRSIEKDPDLRLLNRHRRYAELIEYAREMVSRPLLFGPLATVAATGSFGESIALGEQNLGWDFSIGCFVAKMNLTRTAEAGNAGDLYVNRDAGHSLLDVSRFPGLTVVRFDSEGRRRGLDLDFPNTRFPYPVFGNCSRAFTHGAYWRSIPRAIVTDIRALNRMIPLYLSNQTWVFPANQDTAPVGTNGDVFASITPYWITTAGCSFSDRPYLAAALEASRAFPPATKEDLVRRGLLAPTIQTLIRKSLHAVANEEEYLTAKAHPTAFPADGVDIGRLVRAAAALKPEGVAPLVAVAVSPGRVTAAPTRPELTYASAYAWAFVLRSDDEMRTFDLKAQGAEEYAFVQTHGDNLKVSIEKTGADSARVTIDRRGLSPVNRLDIAVFGRSRTSGWGAPSYVSFARMDAWAPYSDPVLTESPKERAR